MKDSTIIDFLLAVAYAVAAISGGMGGCASASYYMTHTNNSRLPFIVAYILLGVVFGVVTLATMTMLGHAPTSFHELVLCTFAGGSAASIALASANFSARVIFRKLGVEIQVTARKLNEDRRKEDEDDA